MWTLELDTTARGQMIDITQRIEQVLGPQNLSASNAPCGPAEAGAVVVFVPHTTAGITINENADPDVVHDMLAQLDAMVPWRQPFYRHGEGNSAAHVKSSLMGSSVTIPLGDGRLALGQWQGVWFCEFDGPRRRQVWITLLK